MWFPVDPLDPSELSELPVGWSWYHLVLFQRFENCFGFVSFAKFCNISSPDVSKNYPCLCPLLNFVTYSYLMARPDQRPETYMCRNWNDITMMMVDIGLNYDYSRSNAVPFFIARKDKLL